jgi:hypothetical protein
MPVQLGCQRLTPRSASLAIPVSMIRTGSFSMTRAVLCRGYRSETSPSERSSAWHTTVPYRAMRSIGSWDPSRVQGLTQHTLASCCYVTVISCGTGVKDNSALTGNQLSCPIAGHLQRQRTTLGQCARPHAHEDDRSRYQLHVFHCHPLRWAHWGNPCQDALKPSATSPPRRRSSPPPLLPAIKRQVGGPAQRQRCRLRDERCEFQTVRL